MFNNIPFLLSPIYLIPALVGVLFYTFTRDKLMINRKLYNEFRRPDGSIHFPLTMEPFWGKDRSLYLIFLLPGFNIIMLIRVIILYFLQNKATQAYLKHYNPVKEEVIL